MNQLHNNAPERFYSLDVLRGIAALSIVFWHWQHFFFSGTNPGTFDVTRLPLSEWVFVLYLKGWLAVDLFFCLSGFIFYLLYSKRVAEGAISPGKFALLRFSRLYPLHLATLLVVATSQAWLMGAGRGYFVYANNDTTHFLLNLFFASSWGLERGQSFNGPLWSVSVEVLLYACFFACCRLFPIRAIVLVFISIIGFTIVEKYYPLVGRGIGSFFLGGCVFLAYQTIIASHRVNTITNWATYLMVGAWSLTLVFTYWVDLTTLSDHSIPFLRHFNAYTQWIIQKLPIMWSVMVLFPLTILSLALFETRRGSLGKRVSFLGDISYSTYLLHFPLQLLFSVAVTWLGLNQSVYYTPWLMGLFFAVLIVTSLISFRHFEMPAQKFIRRIGVNRRTALKPAEGRR